MGTDTYGTLPSGQRGLFEVLQKLNLPVERGLAPTDRMLSEASAVVFWNPDSDLIRTEPGRFTRIRNWIEQGGIVIAAPSHEATKTRTLRSPKDLTARDTDLLTELGIRGLIAQPVSTGIETTATTTPTMTEYYVVEKRRTNTYASVSVDAEGDLSELGAVVRTLTVPDQDFYVFDETPATERPSGRITWNQPADTSHTVVAVYRIGNGEVLLVSDHRLFENRLVAKTDNPILAAHLFARAPGLIVFDEFYHGLTIRGNPFWLLLQFPYGLIALLVLVAALLRVWRRSVFLGPPLAEAPALRRTLQEYVDAMARMFRRSDNRKFLLHELREGVLRAIRVQKHLPHERKNVDSIAAVLERKEPDRARRLRAAVENADALVNNSQQISETEMVMAARELNRCL